MNENDHNKQQESHVKNCGNNCPKCNSKNIESTAPVDVDGAFASQEITCCDCDAVWKDNYELTGFSDFSD